MLAVAEVDGVQAVMTGDSSVAVTDDSASLDPAVAVLDRVDPSMLAPAELKPDAEDDEALALALALSPDRLPKVSKTRPAVDVFATSAQRQKGPKRQRLQYGTYIIAPYRTLWGRGKQVRPSVRSTTHRLFELVPGSPAPPLKRAGLSRRILRAFSVLCYFKKMSKDSSKLLVRARRRHAIP